MCGIAGIVRYNLEVAQYSCIINSMIETMAHRGPDDHALYFGNHYCFGHTRLSIIDPKISKQPMIDPISKNTIVFNGEVYGYRDIKTLYEEYNFITNSDTELLLAMYLRNGEKMVNQISGMFAFAIWDESSKKLFAARDRFGEKPFYYTVGKNGEFIFASELKTILKSALVDPVLDKESLHFYLRRLYVHPHRTIFKNIFTLPPAHALSYKDGKIKIWRYWDLPHQIKHNISLPDAKYEFMRLLNKSVENQLIADVPVAAFLSGGLDSSTIVAIASKYKKGLTAFSFGFEGAVSELQYAQQIVNKYKINHVILEEKEFDIAELIVKMQSIYDEPFADSSNIPTYLISKLASKYVKVVLTGDGCDEFMLGYNFWYRKIYQYQKAKNSTLPNLFYSIFMRSLSYRLKLHAHKSYHNRITGFGNVRKYSSVYQLHQQQRNYFSLERAQTLFINAPPIKNTELDFKSLRDIFNDDISNYLAGDILVKTDRASMANGLELRTPFLDKDFAEFCILLPDQFKINDTQEKILLRKTCESLWTENIRQRKKQGFAAPVNAWLKKPSLVRLKAKYLKDKRNKIFSVLKYKSVTDYYNKDNIQTWILLNLAIWMENYHFKIE